MIHPSDVFEMEGEVGTAKVALTNNLVPAHKHERKVFGILLSNRASVVNTLTLTIELDTTVERTIPPITLGANATIDIHRPLNAPILTIPAGRNIKAVATSPSISVVLNAYDL